MGNAHDNFKQVRDARTKIIRPNDFEAELMNAANFQTTELSNINNPAFKRIIKDYSKSLRDNDKGKILEKIVFDDGSAYYVIKGANFKNGGGESVDNKVGSIVKRWKECAEETKRIKQTRLPSGRNSENLDLVPLPEKDEIIESKSKSNSRSNSRLHSRNSLSIKVNARPSFQKVSPRE
jgi:hypothetical protein